MANYAGTSASNTVFAPLEEDNFFSGFGVGLDRITGGNRQDVFKIGTMDGGRDMFDGGAGRDHLDLSSADLSPRLNVTLADPGQTGSMSFTIITGFFPTPTYRTVVFADLKNIEDVTGTVNSDTIVGNSQDNLLDGNDGNDIISGGGGNDTLLGGKGDDTLRGGVGKNSVDGGEGNDSVVFTFDRPTRSDQKDVVSGGAGTDTLSFENAGPDFLGAVVSLSTEFAPNPLPGIPMSERSIDTGFIKSLFSVYGGSTYQAISEATITQIENVVGSAMDDIIIGDRNGNTLSGGNGDDLLSGETGLDTLDGGAGDDTFESYADGVTDTIGGGTGIDTVTYARSDRQMIVTLADEGGTGTANATASTGGFGINFVLEDRLTSIENVTGSRHNDRIQGNGGDNELKGADGSDILLGGGGEDILNGGRGQDDLTGGAGADIFRVWDLGVGSSADEIMDFVSGTDMIDFSGFFSNARANHWASSAQPAPDFRGSGSFSGDGEAELRIVQSNGLTRVQLDFGDGALGQNDVEVLVHGAVGFGDLLL